MVLYIEMDQQLKDRLTSLAKQRDRKISAEAKRAIREYLDREEPKEQTPKGRGK